MLNFMARQPLILVTPSVEKRGVEFHDLSTSLSVKYEMAVARAGGIPMAAPAVEERALLAECVRRADGVLLSGGDDIQPSLYIKTLPPAVRRTVNPPPDGGKRDWRELVLIDECFRQHKSLLAICRGHQLLQVAFGGRLVADIRSEARGALNHNPRGREDEIVHEAPLTEGSFLSKITGKRILGVNSSHHQAVLNPAGPFTATARTRDGIVEAMELKPEAAGCMPFLMGVQFHPERLADRHAEHRAIFSRFIEAASENARHESQSSDS
ncbi:MAG: gamma-glutamyl-gamma-aminobutyrate hydrolase family protein [Verrucomicrobia bacterium]|nr:gamma-glutamyl-gamma-aminobutyrate hydrolase family protein [Verrucomicrobiota bacterium]MDE3099349.1 gamma-glutamyl-gamma-aminobutyrate hydrolase family protein [Verrucomicrobiota bacterium]